MYFGYVWCVLTLFILAHWLYEQQCATVPPNTAIFEEFDDATREYTTLEVLAIAQSHSSFVRYLQDLDQKNVTDAKVRSLDFWMEHSALLGFAPVQSTARSDSERGTVVN